MQPTSTIRRLETFPAAVRAAVRGVTAEEARYKPATGAWSILEIINHLGDEEVEDFRTRLELTQRDPAAPWPGIDPEGWAVKRAYNTRDLEESVARFERERSTSVAWLKGLRSPDWNVAYLHPRHGPIRAGDLLASWGAHDALHLRQIAKRLFELASRDLPGFVTRYAGEWGV
jgi:hypothetical protein